MTSRLNDADRLAALERSGLMRFSPNVRLTHVCYTAVELTAVDASQLNVLNATQQLHIAEWPPVAPRENMNVLETGCLEVIVVDDVVAITDTLKNPVMCKFPWTEEFRGYLGAPVHYDDEVIGSLCGLSRTPREWTTRDKLAIKTLADLAGVSIVYERQHLGDVPSEHG